MDAVNGMLPVCSLTRTYSRFGQGGPQTAFCPPDPRGTPPPAGFFIMCRYTYDHAEASEKYEGLGCNWRQEGQPGAT